MYHFKKTLLFILFSSFLLNIFFIYEKIYPKSELEKDKIAKIDISIKRNYFNENISLKNYENVRYRIKAEGENIIQNIRNIHKSPVLISREFQNKEVCVGYISELTKKIWGEKSIYSIGMQNINKGMLAPAWELPYFYEQFGGKILIDLGNKFSIENKDYIKKIDIKDLKLFFSKAFSEEALFGDIGFLYSKTKYSSFLKNWSYNSHITKNMGISDFEIIIGKIDNKKTDLENILDNIGCDKIFGKYIKILENYKIFLNKKQITLYKNNFYYLKKNNILGKKIKLKYLDKIEYKDIIIAHFFEGKAEVESLFKFTCDLTFYPINIISINSRMIEKK